MNKYYFHFLKERKSLSPDGRNPSTPSFAGPCLQQHPPGLSVRGCFSPMQALGLHTHCPSFILVWARELHTYSLSVGSHSYRGSLHRTKVAAPVRLEESGREFSTLPGISQNQQSDDQRGRAMEPAGLPKGHSLRHWQVNEPLCITVSSF